MPVLTRLRAWRRRRVLERHPVDDDAWHATLATLPLLAALDRDGQQRLRELATLFLHAKRFYGAHALTVDPPMRLAIAAQACLPVLNLGFDWLRGWTTVVLYADSFLVDLEEADADGVVHAGQDERIGEAWERGPLVLSWADARPGAEPYGEGSNVVLHEIAHKLDQLDPDSEGRPPLHRGMDPAAWSRDFSRAYAELCAAVDRGEPTWIDPYASAAPGEFFAVLSEHFFVEGAALQVEAPAVYAQLRAFYRQDPAARG